MRPDVSIIVVSYNVCDLLDNCLSSVYRYSENIRFEIIVADNASSDNSLFMIQKKYPEVKVIANSDNLGFSEANNQGMRIAQGEFIFLLNPDTEFTGNTLRILCGFMKEKTLCSLVAPKLLNTDLTLQKSAWKDHKVTDLILETFFLHRVFDLISYPDDYFDSDFQARTFSGAALFFRRSLIENTGMLDTDLFWMEDIDFCVRAGREGELWYCAGTKVIHHSGQSQKKNYNRSIANQLLSKLKYYRKYFNIAAVIAGDLFCFIFILTRILMFTLLSPFRLLYRLKLKAYIYSLGKYLKFIFINKKELA